MDGQDELAWAERSLSGLVEYENGMIKYESLITQCNIESLFAAISPMHSSYIDQKAAYYS